jgi:RNA polymerase sigma-70 factor (ECF subfamily)
MIVVSDDRLPRLMSSHDLAQAAGAATTLSVLSDDELVARARASDVAAFEELVGRHEEKVYRLAMRFTRNETDAAEILQETFLSAWRNLDGFQGKAQFASWLYRVAVNAALMLLRSQKRHPQVAVEDVTPEALGEAAKDAGPGLGAGTDWSRRPDEQFQSDELRRQIQSAVDQLPESQRSVFLMRDVDGLSTEETGELLGLSLPTVKTRLHRARLALREAITRYFERS